MYWFLPSIGLTRLGQFTVQYGTMSERKFVEIWALRVLVGKPYQKENDFRMVLRYKWVASDF